MKQLKKLNLEIKLYFFGVVLFMIGLIIPLPTQFKTIIYMIAILISGFHVMWEGLSDTVTNSLSRKKFLPNTHILMTIAALGAIFIGEAIEAALLIFISFHYITSMYSLTLYLYYIQFNYISQLLIKKYFNLTKKAPIIGFFLISTSPDQEPNPVCEFSKHADCLLHKNRVAPRARGLYMSRQF